MPIKVPDTLPAKEILTNENIFVMPEDRAAQQDIRPLRIAILNLMPTKIVTETQILRLLGNTSLQVEIELLHPKTYTSKNTPKEHLITFYKTFEEIKDQRFDGMVITGAPVEQLPFEEVAYWEELKEIMDWASHNVFSTIYLCWGAQAGLYHHFGVPKYSLKEKMFGIFSHTITKRNVKLLRGFDDIFHVPHSRHTETRCEDVEKVPELNILSVSETAGLYLAATQGGRHIFAMGHSEYDPLTLKTEFDRDINKGLKVPVPQNYFPNDDPTREPIVNWRGHSNLLFSNWLNYYVYQETPYDLNKIK